MNQNQPDFSDPMKLLRAPQARLLMEQLQKLDPAVLQQAADLACAGDSDGARALLCPKLKQTDAQPSFPETEQGHGRS